MMFTLTIILAASLQSYEIGNYFTLPSWMPKEVSSFNTPGSDPSGEGGGWYLIQGVETTKVERVTQHFKIINTSRYREWWDGKLIEDITDIDDVTSRFDDQHWTSVATNEFYFNGSNLYMGWDKVAQIEKDAEFYSWESGREGYFPGGKYIIDNNFSAYADRIDTNIECHITYVPRSPRMTGEILSGINSTFEGIFERTYEASKGYSNVWDLVQYGPVAKKLFWFDIPNGVNNVNIYQPMTNRVITSRRFDEYGNINRVAAWFTDYFFKNGSRTTIERPGWMSSDGSQELWWTTTNEIMPQDFVPSFDWVEDPTKTNYWATCLATFGGLESDGIWDVQVYSEDYPGVKLMKKLNWYQPNYDYERCKWNGKSLYGNTNLTMRKVIEAAYPRGDGWAITNQTRRLFFQELSCLNQSIGLMDRTYHVPNVTYYGWETNETYKNSANVSGVCEDVEVVWSRYGKKYKTKDTEFYFEWGDTGRAHMTTNINGSGVSPCDRIEFQRTTPINSVSPNFYISTNTSSGVMFPQSGDHFFIEEALRRIKQRFPAVWGESSFGMSITFDGSMSNEECFNANIWFGSNFGNVNLYSDIQPFTSVDTMDFEAKAVCSRRYNYFHNNAVPSVGLTQIGDAGNTDIALISSLHYRVGYTNDIHVSGMPYSASNSVCIYKTNMGGYQSISDISNTCKIATSNARTKFIELNNGRNPSNPTLFIPLNEGIIRSTLGSVKIKNVEISFTHLGSSHYLISGQIENGEPTDLDVYTFLDSGSGMSQVVGVEPTIYPSFSSLEYEMDNMPDDPDVGVTTFGKSSVITRKKWNFKTLHRDD